MAHNVRFSEENLVIVHNFDPDASDTLTTVSSSGWVDMKGWRKVTAILFRFKGTGVVQAGRMYCSASATGTSAQPFGPAAGSDCAGGIFTGDGGVTTNKGSGIFVIEGSADEMAATSLGGDARYVSAYASLATGTDEMGVVYILSDPDTKQADLTVSRSVGDAASG